jgi:hypothetical protein
MKEYSKSIDLKMSFTAQLLKGCIGSDIVKVVSRYLSSKNATFKQLCIMGLVEQVMDICQNNNDYYRGFMIACEYGILEIVKIIINIKNQNFNINNGMYLICRGNHLEILNLLIAHGASELYTGFYGICTIEPFYITNNDDCIDSRYSRLDIINVLINHGATDWNKGLFIACQSKKLDIVELMLERGATLCEYCNNNNHRSLMLKQRDNMRNYDYK